MAKRTHAAVDFALSWQSPFATHTDVLHVPDLDVTRDQLPDDFAEKITALKVSESYNQTFNASALIGAEFSPDHVVSFNAEHFDTRFKGQHSPPRLYRFYPSAIAWQGLNSDYDDYTPFRLISANADYMMADTNHPLAKYYLRLSATKLSEHSGQNEQSTYSEKPARNIIQRLSARGPGMQMPFEYGDPVFFTHTPFKRTDETDDAEFYAQANLKPHADAAARADIAALYARLLPNYSKVLDLMSSHQSHLNDDTPTGLLAGLGMNEAELQANPRLNTYIVQNLNNEPTLPYEDNSFDNALCALSIEYLTDPLPIMREVARVIATGGKFIVTFSERWFPTKAINLWAELHPFERQQLVLEYFRQSACFEGIHTYSKRGVPRPKDDETNPKKPLADAVFAVWGTVK